MGKTFLYGQSMEKDQTHPYATLTVHCPVGVTVRATNETDTFDKVADNGKAIFYRLASGEWDITFVDIEYAPSERITIDSLDYELSMTYFKATVEVTYPAGSVCTCSDGTTTIAAPDTSGHYIFEIKYAGHWVISCVDGDQSQSATVDIDNDGDSRSVSLTYNRLAILNENYPADITAKTGDSVTFEAKIQSDGYPTNYAYQWYVNDVAISEANSSSYIRDTSADSGIYSVYCKVTTVAGSITSRTAVLTVNKMPALNENYPADVNIIMNNSATFDVYITADGYPSEYSYQWYINNEAVPEATGSSYTISNVLYGVTTIYCLVTNAGGTVASRTATLTGLSTIPEIMYDGDYEIVDDSDNIIENSGDNWKIRFLTSGTLIFTNLNGAEYGIDVFCVGGGGGSSKNNSYYPSGGGGGYTMTKTAVSVESNTEYHIVVGTGGPPLTNGGTTSAFTAIAAGGCYAYDYSFGGDGGSGGGGNYAGSVGMANGGSNGSDGFGNTLEYFTPGKGQISKPGPNGETGNTSEFGEEGNTLYSGGGAGSPGEGGAGGGGDENCSGATNTGGGAGCSVYTHTGTYGGSGIVVIRNTR